MFFCEWLFYFLHNLLHNSYFHIHDTTSSTLKINRHGILPLCEKWPEEEKKYLTGTTVHKDSFLWVHNCNPVYVDAQKGSNGSDGMIIIRMLDFGETKETIQDVYEKFESNSLSSFKIEKNKIDAIKKNH